MDYEEIINNSETWFSQAQEMLAASKILSDSLSKRVNYRRMDDNTSKVGVLKGSALLLGISIENALKGAHARKSGKLSKNGVLNKSIFSDDKKSQYFSMIRG